MNRAPLRHRG